MENFKLVSGLNESARIIHQQNKEKGFWDNERYVGELLMLVVCELSEAMEAHRKGKFANWSAFSEGLQANNLKSGEDFSDLFLEHIKDSFEDEIADSIIRLLDLCSGLDIDIETQIRSKVVFNRDRPRLHGKLY